MKHLISLILAMLIIGCNSKKREITRLVETWQNREILFPDSMEMKIYGKDTIIDLTATEYRILNYIDTNGCTECRMKLYDWLLLKQEADSLQLDVTFVFVAYVKQFKGLENMQKINRFNAPILYDRIGEMNKLNQFPEHPGFQTFLLDKQNRVILIGSPIRNEKLWTLYKERIKQKK